MTQKTLNRIISFIAVTVVILLLSLLYLVLIMSIGLTPPRHYLMTKVDSNGNTLWTQKYGWGGWHEEINGLAIDSKGDIIAVGLENPDGMSNFSVMKCNPNGEILWSENYSNGIARSVVIDSEDNIIVVGQLDMGGCANGFLTIKYTGNGNITWVKTYMSGHYAWTVGVDTDSKDNIIVAGEVEGNSCLIKYDSNGTVLWEKKVADETITPHQEVRDVTVDFNDDIILVGKEWFVTTEDNSVLEGDKCIITKYYPNGTQIWSKMYKKGVEDVWGNAVTTDSENNIIVAGGSFSSFFPVIKYSPEGNILWVRNYAAPCNVHGMGIAVASQDDVIVVASGGMPDDKTSVKKYNSNGNVLWSKEYPSKVVLNDICVASDNHIILGGTYWAY